MPDIRTRPCITLRTNDLRVAAAPHVLHTRGIGSCVAIALYAPGRAMGGMAHISRAEKTDDLPDENLHRYADYAVGALVRILSARIMADPPPTGRDFTARIAGGGNMFQGIMDGYPDVGTLNVDAVRRALHIHHISLVGEDVFGGLGRSMWFDLATGVVQVSCAGRSDVFF